MARSKALAAADQAGMNLFQDLMDEGVIEGNEALDEGLFVQDKNDLVGIPLIVLDWRHGEYGGGIPKVMVNLVVSNGDKMTLMDTSAGIRLQLEDMTRKFNGWDKDGEIPDGTVSVPPKPLYFPKGLRVSNYGYEDKLAGTTTPASTFYLDGSK